MIERDHLANIELGPQMPNLAPKCTPLTRGEKVRSSVVRWVARRLAVPIDIHGSFFKPGKNVPRTFVSGTAPK